MSATETPPVEHLLRHNARLRAEVARLREDRQRLLRRIRDLQASRDQWRSEARDWKWSALRERG